MSKLKSNLQIGSKIAGGHFGDVHLATDDVHGQVAVKVLIQLPGEDSKDWAARKENLLAEGQHLSTAAHPNVVRVHHLLQSESDDSILLVMEYCAGGSLQGAFESGPMTLSEVRRLSTDVCLGLNALHSHGMLHRDIKPGNILLTSANVTKLGDFGLVTDELILGYGSQVGYKDHIAIEVWKGHGTSIRSDMWALGMTIYRLLHGAEWYSQLPAAPRDVIGDGKFSASLRWLPHIPDKWRRFVRKMMNDNSRQRCQDANQAMSIMAKLPCHPDWTCTVAPTEIRWTREANGRRINVVWTKYSKHRHEWKAWSEPLSGTGRSHSLGGSKGIISHSKADEQLRKFLT